jgi:hypothetical protein
MISHNATDNGTPTEANAEAGKDLAVAQLDRNAALAQRFGAIHRSQVARFRCRQHVPTGRRSDDRELTILVCDRRTTYTFIVRQCRNTVPYANFLRTYDHSAYGRGYGAA